MNSFTLTAVGNLARNPEGVAKGDITYTRFLLVGNDYGGKDDEGAPREIVTSLWFVAFGALAESLVRSARKGDQLIVEARVRASSWTDKQGEKQYDHDFVVQGFRFGAPGKVKREERDARREDGAHRGEDRGNGRGGNGAAIVPDGDSCDASGDMSPSAAARATNGTGARKSTNGAGGTSGSKGADSRSNGGNGANVDAGATGSSRANAGAGATVNNEANGGKRTSSGNVGNGANVGDGATGSSGVNVGADAADSSGTSVGTDATGRKGASAGRGASGSNGATGATVSAPAANEKPAASPHAGRSATWPPP